MNFRFVSLNRTNYWRRHCVPSQMADAHLNNKLQQQVLASYLARQVCLPGQVVEESGDEHHYGVTWPCGAVEVPRRDERSTHAREAINGHQNHHPDGHRLNTPNNTMQPPPPSPPYFQPSTTEAPKCHRRKFYN